MADTRILIVAADGFEDMELLAVKYRLEEAGMDVDIAAPGKEDITGKRGYVASPTMTVAEAAEKGSCGYAMLLLPGGKAPAALREMADVLSIVRDFQSSGSPIAAICHGPQLLVSAGGIKGRRMTGYAGIKDELEGAGVLFEDSALVVDGPYITSRKPLDLPHFQRAIMAALPQG